MSELVKTCNKVEDRNTNDLHLQPSDAMDRSKCREMIGGNWSDSSDDRDAARAE